jgi:hypothetical protein
MPCRPHLLVALIVAICVSCLPNGGAARPAAAQTAAPDPRFGIVESYVNSEAATEAGAGYTRVIIRWDVVQPGGPLDWKPANVPDPYIDAELAAGRQVVALLIGTPGWAAADPAQAADPLQAGAEGARAVPDMDRWRTFVIGMVQRYRGRIHQWVIWNEPDVWMADHPGNTWAGSVEDYYRLLKTAYTAIKEQDPAAQVTLAGLTYFWDEQHGRRPYLDRLLDVIAADPEAPAHNFFFDAVVYHLYFNPLQAPQVIGLAQASLAAHGMVGKPIWINETNAPPADDSSELPWSTPRFQITTGEQAAFILQEFSLAFAAGAARVEVYKLRNTADHPESIEPFGLLRADNSPRPAFDAYRTMTAYLAGFKTARLVRQGDVYVVTFDRGDSSTTVLWTMGRGPARVSVPALGSSAILVDVTGTAQPIAAANGAYVVTLPPATCACGIIGGAPRLLVEVGSRAGHPVSGATPALPDPAVPTTPTVITAATSTASAPIDPPPVTLSPTPTQTRCHHAAESLLVPYESIAPGLACGW